MSIFSARYTENNSFSLFVLCWFLGTICLVLMGVAQRGDVCLLCFALVEAVSCVIVPTNRKAITLLCRIHSCVLSKLHFVSLYGMGLAK